MRRFTLRLLAISMFLTVQACAIRVPQVEAALNQLQSMAGPKEELKEAVWLASFNGQGAVYFRMSLMATRFSRMTQVMLLHLMAG